MDIVSEASTENNKKEAHSYHTFLFPFIYGVNKFEDINSLYNNIYTYLNEDDWNKLYYKQSNEKKNEDEFIKIYNSYKYYHNSTFNLLYPNDVNNNPIVKKFSYNISNSSYKLQILKDQNETTNIWGFDVSLDIKAIELSFYKTGVAILSIELENYNEEDINEILKINEYTRRLHPPFMPAGIYENHLVADNIVLLKDEGIVNNFSIKDYINSMKNNSKEYNFSTITHIINFLLGKKFNFESSKNSETELVCKTIDDDRMFVVCAYKNKQMIETLSKWDGSNYLYERDSNFEKINQYENTINKLYEFLFIDGDGLTCQDKQMKIDLLRDHLYTRWIDYGSIYGVTQHSLVLLTDSWTEHVKDAFLNVYKNMAILALTQRASLIAMDEQTSNIVNNIDDGSKVSNDNIKKINKLQENYIKILNQLLKFEPTGQEQGIELYGKFKKFMFIEQEHKFIEKQMNSLYEMSIVNSNRIKEIQDNWRNGILAIIAIISFLFQLFD